MRGTVLLLLAALAAVGRAETLRYDDPVVAELRQLRIDVASLTGKVDTLIERNAESERRFESIEGRVQAIERWQWQMSGFGLLASILFPIVVTMTTAWLRERLKQKGSP